MRETLTVQANYRKIHIPISDIAYMTMDGRKTKLTLGDGSSVLTNQSMKELLSELPESIFSNINRGVVISRNFVKSDRNGVVTMEDGTVLRRRVRSDRLPKKPAPAHRSLLAEPPRAVCPGGVLGQWLDAMPLPMLILELVYGKPGGVDFIIRYSNREMAALIAAEPEIGASVQSLPGIGSTNWMAIYANVAINGGNRIIENVLEGSGRFLQLQCYQPQPGFCACVLTDCTRENRLIQELFRQDTL